ncbi:hypothetical protein D3C80_1518230 [compost metagenome]
MADKADALGNVGRHFGLEGAGADEGDDRVQVLRVYPEGGFQGFEVFVVLPQRVLEFEGAFVELLRPLGLLFAAEDPAVHILRFQHENTVHRDENVVDLGGAVRGVQGDVVQAAIGLLVQVQVGEVAYKQLAEVALYTWRLECEKQDDEGDEPAQGDPVLGDDGCEVHFLPYKNMGDSGYSKPLYEQPLT